MLVGRVKQVRREPMSRSAAHPQHTSQHTRGNAAHPQHSKGDQLTAKMEQPCLA